MCFIFIDIDECIDSHACNQRCENTIGSYKCLCRHGFEFTTGSTTECISKYGKS